MFSDENQTTKNSEMLIQSCFEKLSSPAFFCAKKAALSLFSNGRPNGFCIDSGASSTEVVPVSDGYILKKGLLSISKGGEYLTNKMLEYIEGKVGKFNPFFDYQFEHNPDGIRNTNICLASAVSDDVRKYFKSRIAREAKELFLKIKTPSFDR